MARPGRLALSADRRAPTIGRPHLWRSTLTDTHLRQLERRRALAPNVADEAAWLAAQARAGVLSPERLGLLGYLDHPAALAALGRAPKVTDLVSWVRGLEPWGPPVVVRAVAAAARSALSSVPAPSWSETVAVPRRELWARRVVDHAEEWLACPCPPHARLAADWARPARGRVAVLCVWAAALAGTAGGHDIGLAAPRRNRIRSPDLVEAARVRLLAWVLDQRETFDRALWLASDGRDLRPLLECPPIDWRCQVCGAFVVRTTEVFPHETNGDSDCLEHPERRCSSGYSTTMVATCSECCQDLEWGDGLCAHFGASSRTRVTR